MKLEIGESKVIKLPFWLKGVDVIHEKNGLSLMRQGQYAVLNATNQYGRAVYASVPLCLVKDLNQVGLTVKVHSKTRMIANAGAVRIVVDFASKKVAVNVLGMLAQGSKEWGDHVQIPWQADYMALFGLPIPADDMDMAFAQLFWQWFHNNETDILRLLKGNSKENKTVMRQINLWLNPVFPYVKTKWLDFDIRCKEEEYLFTINCAGNERLKADVAVFGEMIPDALKGQWHLIIKE